MNLGNLRARWNFVVSHPAFQKHPIAVLCRVLIWRLHCSLNWPADIYMPQRDLSMSLPPEWRGPAKFFYTFRDDCEPDLELLGKFLGPGKTMIDIGANYGIFSLTAARLVGEEGEVIAFEPTQATFDIFKNNLALNRASNVKAMRIALGDKPGRLRLYHDIDSSRNSLAPANPSQDYEEVEVRTLDSVIKESDISRIDFIKIDVEGADELVCRSGSETLQKYRPPVFFENNRYAASQMGLKGGGTPAFLAGLGYEFYQYHNGEIIKLANGDLPDGNILALLRS
jgi:FkbM family methyltransferase